MEDGAGRLKPPEQRTDAHGRRYTEFEKAFAAQIDEKPHNAFYDRPAVLSLLPDVRGLDVLDAGCGPGAYLGSLLERGAQAVGVDVSPTMVGLARERLGEDAPVRIADLTLRLPFDDDSFDGVVCPLVLDNIEDWEATMAEFARVVRPRGWLVLSTIHPAAEYYLRPLDDSVYFEVETRSWHYSWPDHDVDLVTEYFRRPLEYVLNTPRDAGFRLDRMLEPRPTREYHAADPMDAETLERRPEFICLRFVREG